MDNGKGTWGSRLGISKSTDFAAWDTSYAGNPKLPILILLSWCSSPSPLTSTAATTHQSCLTLCHPIDSSPPGSAVPGILPARTLKWVAISFSNAWKRRVKVKSLSVWLLATPWTAAHQAPPPIAFSRQEYWSGVPSPSLYMVHSQ